jgi:hypothetical protein
MADDWQKGDLALCVSIELPGRIPSKILRVGAVYTVNSVRWSGGEQCTPLGLAEVKSRGKMGDWYAVLFRKIRPHTPDAFDAEIIDLISRKPVEA